MQTQSNSRARIKNDTVGNDGMQLLFQEYQEATSMESFRNTCSRLILDSSGKKSTKDRFLAEINRSTSREMMLTKVTNYMMAGQGLGV
jgi:hypothetical protein